MTPTPAERDALLANFSAALRDRDLDTLFRMVAPDFLWNYHDGVSVTKSLMGSGPISDHLAEQTATYAVQRFHERVYHHLDDMTFMTMRVSETVRMTGEKREQRGIERYTFKGGRIAIKDVYRKPIRV